MEKKNIIVVGIIILVLMVVLVISYKNNDNKLSNNLNNITIIRYKLGTDKVIKKIKITSMEDKEKLEKWAKKLNPLTPKEMVDLALANEVEIKYGDYITIGIQLSEKDYCYYTNHDRNISELSKMPKGLSNWLEEKLK